MSDRLPRSIDLVFDVDSDWAGDKRERKSTLCVVARHGVNVMKTQVNAMKGIAMSSGEAEYGAIVKGACQGLGIQSMAADWGIKARWKVRSDSSAAIGISNRFGLEQRSPVGAPSLGPGQSKEQRNPIGKAR